MASSSRLILVLLTCLLLIGPASAFGAGEVPGASEFKGYVWRHGDIAEVLKYLPVSFVTNHRFSQLQRRQIYFGNWLRDFSQVIDTTCLENVPEPILRAIVSVLAFMEFGFATDEFDVSRERLGCYSHVEHIDNPLGYPENAKEVDDRLRGPLDPRELEFDPKTGMKNYIANSGQGWPTSADYIRQQLKNCIELGRKGAESDHAARKESFIHLGAALHTLEDFAAHSNFTELCLRELGEDGVFAFVGDECTVTVPHRIRRRRQVAPLVTGTFGMLDIFHSLLGEVDDMAILQSKGSLGELEQKLNYGGKAFEQLFELIKGAIEALSSLATEESPLLQQLETVGLIFEKAKEAAASSSDSDNASGLLNPNLLWQSIEPIFYLHDRMSKWLQEGEEKPEDVSAKESTNQIGEYTDQLVFKFLAVMIESSVRELRNALRAAKTRVDEEAAKSNSAAVYQNGSTASDPSHSDLSKDHFSNVLNQPAGLVATVTTNWAVQEVVKCWDDPGINVDDTIDDILKVLHHPAFAKKKTPIQRYMFDTVKNWWEELTEDERNRMRSRLTRESVKAREHEDHELTLKDLIGRHKGEGKFPGSHPETRPPPRKPSFPIRWAVNEALSDVNWALGTLRMSLTDPLGAFVNVVKGAGSAVAGAVHLVIALMGWIVTLLASIASRLWPSRR